MKKLLLTSAIVFIISIAQAQNLVPNYSFESFTSCPTATAQFNLIPPWQMPANTSSASSDYFNACNTNATADVPTNVAGSQNARTGVGYAGIYTYGSGVREYMQIQLSAPLIAGTVYNVEMYVSPAEEAGMAADAIGIHISTGAISGTGSYSPLPFIPQIVNPTNNIISDTTVWTLVSGSYTALGGENYITIGNFLNDANTNSLTFNSSGWSRGYYYIDDVSVAPASETLINENETTNSVAIFPNPFSAQTVLQTNTSLNNATLSVQNCMGQIVKQITNISGHTVILPREFLANGLYFITLTQDDKVITTKKVVITD